METHFQDLERLLLPAQPAEVETAPEVADEIQVADIEQVAETETEGGEV
jgi:hypothetical protein